MSDPNTLASNYMSAACIRVDPQRKKKNARIAVQPGEIESQTAKRVTHSDVLNGLVVENEEARVALGNCGPVIARRMYPSA